MTVNCPQTKDLWVFLDIYKLLLLILPNFIVGYGFKTSITANYFRNLRSPRTKLFGLIIASCIYVLHSHLYSSSSFKLLIICFHCCGVYSVKTAMLKLNKINPIIIILFFVVLHLQRYKEYLKLPNF